MGRERRRKSENGHFLEARMVAVLLDEEEVAMVDGGLKEGPFELGDVRVGGVGRRFDHDDLHLLDEVVRVLFHRLRGSKVSIRRYNDRRGRKRRNI